MIILIYEIVLYVVKILKDQILGADIFNLKQKTNNPRIIFSDQIRERYYSHFCSIAYSEKNQKDIKIFIDFIKKYKTLGSLLTNIKHTVCNDKDYKKVYNASSPFLRKKINEWIEVDYKSTILDKAHIYEKLRNRIINIDDDSCETLSNIHKLFFDYYTILASDLYNIMLIYGLRAKRIICYNGNFHTSNIAWFFTNEFKYKYKKYTQVDNITDPEAIKYDNKCLIVNNLKIPLKS